MRKEGIGSYFNLENFQNLNKQIVDLNFDYKIFYTGRHALLYILNEIANSKKINKIWFPNYYCQHTLSWIKKSYPNIHLYKINPFEFSTDIINIDEFTEANDIVLINNYWGLSSMRIKNNCDALVIEDHSHGWLSNQCLQSSADYCFVSLRKSLPIPLGGIYWKPNKIVSNKKFNFNIDDSFYKLWNMMLKAMKLKSKYIIESKNIDASNSNYLKLFFEVEKALNEYTGFVALTDDHKAFIETWMRLNVKKIKDENLNFLYSKIEDNSYFKIVKKSNHTAFGFNLLFKDKARYNSFKNYLIDNSIFPSSLWPDNSINYEWRYFLNIHTDFRYNLKDMNYIVLIINQWLKA